MTIFVSQPLQKVNTVLLHFTMLDMEMGVQDLHLGLVEDMPVYYVANGYELSMDGNWEIDLITRPIDSNDVKGTLRHVAQP